MRLLGFILPLVVYFVVEYLFDTITALVVSSLFPLGQIVWKAVREKKFDFAALSDLVLLLLFTILEFVPYKATSMSLIVALVLVLSLLGVVDLFRMMLSGIVPSVFENPFAVYRYKQSQKRMLFWSILSVVLFFYAEFYPEKQLSVWIQQWWLLTVLLAYFALELICSRISFYKYRNVEWLPLVNESAKVVGVCPRPLVHNGSLWLHPVVHLHVINDGKLLLQLRPKTKKIQPNKWDTAVGGHMSAGEKLEDALRRESWEEIGLCNFEAKMMKQYVWKCPVEHEYVFSFMTESKSEFKPKNIDEVDELRFWSVQEIRDNIGKEVFTPNLESELTEWVLPLLMNIK